MHLKTMRLQICTLFVVWSQNCDWEHLQVGPRGHTRGCSKPQVDDVCAWP